MKYNKTDSVNQTPEQQCRERYQKARSAWTDFYTVAHDDLRFLNGDQWDSRILQERKTYGRPSLTLPRISNFIRQLETQLRQSETSISVSSRTNNDKESCDILESIVRSIESTSVAKSAYTTAGQMAVRTGLGFIRVLSKYPSFSSFDQDLYIEAVTDTARVLFDPSARDLLLSDAEYVFIETLMPRQEFEATIASKAARERIKTAGFLAYSDQTVDSESIKILEYFYKTSESVTVYKYVNAITQEATVTDQESTDPNMFLVNKRKSSRIVINHCLFDGVEFYNPTTFPGQIIPVVPVFGEVCNINGDLIIKGAVADCKDAQRLLNYATSAAVEAIDSAPRSPWVIPAGAIDGYEQQWQNANNANYAFLLYDPKKTNGAAPSRTPNDTNITAISSVKAQAEQDIQNIFGIFDTQLGANSQEVSGVAINARNASAERSTYIYRDNLNSSIRQVGQIIVDAIPTYYNGRTVTAIKANGTDMEVEVNFDELSSYQVKVQSGPNDETQREALTDQLMKLAQVLPQAAPLLGDIIVQNSNLIGAEPVVARLKTLLPPEIVQSESQEIDQKSATTMLAQATQQLQQLNAAAQETEMQLQAAQQELNLMKTDRAIEMQKMQQDYDIKSKELQLKATELELDFEIKSQELSTAQAKLVSERQGVEHDNLPNI